MVRHVGGALVAIVQHGAVIGDQRDARIAQLDLVEENMVIVCLVERRRHHVGLFAQLLVSGVGKIPLQIQRASDGEHHDDRDGHYEQGCENALRKRMASGHNQRPELLCAVS